MFGFIKTVDVSQRFQRIFVAKFFLVKGFDAVIRGMR